jgi:hypothetical protein
MAISAVRIFIFTPKTSISHVKVLTHRLKVFMHRVKMSVQRVEMFI